MFDNLKSKLKGLFKKAPAEVAEPEAPAEEPAAQPQVEQIPAAPAPVPAEEKKPEPQLSRKEQLKAEKEAKKAAKKAPQESKKPEDMVSEKGGFFDKKIKEDSLDDLLWDLELALMEADVALPVVEEIKEGVRENLLGK